MHRRRPGTLFFAIGLAAVAQAATAAPAPRAGTERDSTPLESLVGYLDRDALAISLPGTHQLTGACSGDAVHLRSATIDLDRYLCRHLRILGPAAGPGGTEAIEAVALFEAANRCPVDCDADGLLDGCAIRHRLIPDCNADGVPDRCDIQRGASLDCNQDGVPDECQTAPCELDDRTITITFPATDWIAWQPERGYSSFNLYRGGLSWLSGGAVAEEGDGALAGGACDLRKTGLREQSAPPPGRAIYYLVTGNNLGAEQRAGLDGNGTLRSHSISCPAPAGPLNVAVRTDKVVYAPGEPVQVEVFLTNLDPAGQIDLRFASDCQVTFRVEDLSGNNVYLDLSHRHCEFSENARRTLRPGQIATYAFAWDQLDDGGRSVPRIANYVVRGMVLYQNPVPDGITGIAIRP
jgi:hypothetical protein